jgi:hypothetical protein
MIKIMLGDEEECFISLGDRAIRADQSSVCRRPSEHAGTSYRQKLYEELHEI